MESLNIEDSDEKKQKDGCCITHGAPLHLYEPTLMRINSILSTSVAADCQQVVLSSD